MTNKKVNLKAEISELERTIEAKINDIWRNDFDQGFINAGEDAMLIINQLLEIVEMQKAAMKYVAQKTRGNDYPRYAEPLEQALEKTEQLLK